MSALKKTLLSSSRVRFWFDAGPNAIVFAFEEGDAAGNKFYEARIYTEVIPGDEIRCESADGPPVVIEQGAVYSGIMHTEITPGTRDYKAVLDPDSVAVVPGEVAPQTPKPPPFAVEDARIDARAMTEPRSIWVDRYAVENGTRLFAASTDRYVFGVADEDAVEYVPADVLDALKEAQAYLPIYDPHDHAQDSSLYGVLQRIDDAIAKAEGRS